MQKKEIEGENLSESWEGELERVWVTAVASFWDIGYGFGVECKVPILLSGQISVSFSFDVKPI